MRKKRNYRNIFLNVNYVPMLCTDMVIDFTCTTI